MATHTAMAQGSNASMRSSLEQNLGILHFASTKEHGWSGQSRTRYTDFQVNELTKDGEVVHLSNFFNNSRELARSASQGTSMLPSTYKPSQPKNIAGEGNAAVKTQEQAAETKTNDRAEEPPKEGINEPDKNALADLVSLKTAEELIAFHARIQENPKAGPKTHGDVNISTITDKSQRSRIHEEIRRIFGGKIETTTGSDGSIVATASRGGNGQRGDRSTNSRARNNRQNPTQRNTAPYLHFSLYKENKDTMDALNHMAKTLRIHPKAFGVAGTKDRRAVTVQRVSVKGRTPASLIVVNERINNIKIGDFNFAQDPIRLNDHDGNEFVIVLKNCVFSGTENLGFEEKLRVATSTVDSAVRLVTQHGFINYYGTQRFGTHQIGTHEVGMKILKEDFAGAVQALLSYDPLLIQNSQEQGHDVGTNRDDINRARACSTFLETKDAEAALRHLPPRCHVEKTVIQHLGRNPTDFVGALTSINRSMRTMYGHAYQSLVWNFAASKRWERFGSQIVKGDLVLVETESAAVQNANDERDAEASGAWEEDVIAVQKHGVVPHTVTEDDIRDGKYSIYDVVLPSPGWDVIYPQNEIGDFYVEFMGRPENGGLDPYNMRRRQRDFSLPGSYRKLMGKLKKIPTSSVQAYSNDLEQLVPTDLDIIRSRKVKEEAERDLSQRAAAASWNAFTQNVQQNELEESRARVARRESEAPTPLASVNDTWIQTSVDGSNKRIKIAKHNCDGDNESSFASPADDGSIRLDNNAQDQKLADVGMSDQAMEIEGASVGEPARKSFSSSIITAAGTQPINQNPQPLPHGPAPQPTSIAIDDAATINTNPTVPPTISTSNSHLVADTEDLPSIMAVDGIEPAETVTAIPADSTAPRKIAVILRFALDTSQYATIVIRELQGATTPMNAPAQTSEGPTPPSERFADSA
ncbi:pseudouridine synthase [Xylaria intraflava]|nr:pseudouridine synthase [Xylaria intraflava]